MNFNRKNAKITLFAGLLLCSSFLLPADYTKITGNPLYKYALLLGGTDTLGAGAVFAGMRPKTLAKVGLALAALYGSARLFERYWTAVPVVQRKPKGLSLAKNKKTLVYSKKIEQAQFNVDGTLLALVDGSNVHVYNTHTTKEIHTITLQEPVVWVEFNQKKEEILLAGNTCVELWNIGQHDAKRVYSVQEKTPIKVVRLSASGDKMLLAYGNRVTIVRNYSSSYPSKQEFELQDVLSAEFNRGGDRILIANNNRAYVWDSSATKKPLYVLEPEKTFISARFSSGGERVLTVDSNGAGRIWFLGQLLSDLPIPYAKKISDVQFSPNGAYVQFSPNGAYLKIKSGERVYLIDPDVVASLYEGNQFLSGLFLNKAGFVNVFFSNDGSAIFTVSDKSIGIWDMHEEKKKEISIVPGSYVQVSPDGSKILIQNPSLKKGIVSYATYILSGE